MLFLTIAVRSAAEHPVPTRPRESSPQQDRARVNHLGELQLGAGNSGDSGGPGRHGQDLPYLLQGDACPLDRSDGLDDDGDVFVNL